MELQPQIRDLRPGETKSEATSIPSESPGWRDEIVAFPSSARIQFGMSVYLPVDHLVAHARTKLHRSLRERTSLSFKKVPQPLMSRVVM